ncbi:hypothetical protein BDV25DRAFT_135306 [Aspergillus avenaceus]|uniref:Putative gamma-glutamylcyclotransferase n=1 Tax=Aspergillus avenaceus TaxID=36643 RepID=A0A5N6U8M6_ASPAV|nr:hypothetical protein BDV25DRAFT_135306 [Aspergillus avenaceus]
MSETTTNPQPQNASPLNLNPPPPDSAYICPSPTLPKDLWTPPAEPYFLYDTLTDPTVLRELLVLKEEPQLRPAYILGYEIKLWGQCPALLDKRGSIVKGFVYDVRTEEDAAKLAAYETKSYREVPCWIRYMDGEKPVEDLGRTFLFAGDFGELREGVFDLGVFLGGRGRGRGRDCVVEKVGERLDTYTSISPQMLQAILALKDLLASGYELSHIIGGDSAGGHLCLSLLSHLHHRRPFEDSVNCHVDRNTGVRGCFLVSPLCSYNFNTPSYKRWFSADTLGQRVSKWGKCLVNGSPWHHEISAGKGWGMALDVPERWWEGLNVVDRILVVGRYEEAFSDHVQQLGATLQRCSKGEVALHMFNEAHDGPLMDFAAGRPPSETTKTITHFMVSSFRE